MESHPPVHSTLVSWFGMLNDFVCGSKVGGKCRVGFNEASASGENRLHSNFGATSARLYCNSANGIGNAFELTLVEI